MNKNYTDGRRWLMLVLASATFWLGSCQKEVQETPQPTATGIEQLTKSQLTANPYSLRNVRKACRRLALQQTKQSQTTTTPSALSAVAVEEYPRYVYFRFDPADLPSKVFSLMENDSTVRLLDFPFASPQLYTEEFVLDEDKKTSLVDGSIYGVTSLKNQEVLTALQNAAGAIKTQFLDTLVLVPEGETALQREALLEAGANPAQLRWPCLFKQPSGFVRYQDHELGRLEPVRGMEVWALVFGIPVWTHTDANGRYSIPWRFSAGTIMGTKAVNNRVKIKPFNTMGGFVAVTAQLITNFIVGSVHVRGTVRSCDMRSDVNFEFWDHRQNKYWSQLLNAYWFQEQYAAQTGVLRAPNNMVCYAHWADAPGFGNASTPMLYQMSGGPITGTILQIIFGNPVTGTLARLLQETLPDMTFKVCGGIPPVQYESRLTQTAFHELGHASMYRQAGAGWWLDVVVAEISNTYGEPGYTNWGKVQIAESWAEYIGTEFAFRRYPNGVKNSRQLGLTPFWWALEWEEWYAEPTRWIPNGVYYDLVDGVINGNPNEPWDRVSGATIGEMYRVFNSGTANICQFRDDFISRYPRHNAADVRTLFAVYNVSCR